MTPTIIYACLIAGTPQYALYRNFVSGTVATLSLRASPSHVVHASTKNVTANAIEDATLIMRGGVVVEADDLDEHSGIVNEFERSTV